MSDLYDTDVLTWSERQAALLQRVAAGERINDQVDWPNVIEEIESVGRSELHAIESLLFQTSRPRRGRSPATCPHGAATRVASGCRPVACIGPR